MLAQQPTKPCLGLRPALYRVWLSKHCREALRIKRRALGPRHPGLGVSLNNIGRALRYQGK